MAAAGRASPWVAGLVVVALAARPDRRQAAALRGRPPRQRPWQSKRSGRWTSRIVRALGSRRTGDPLVLASAVLGVPPLAAVSLAAGAAGQRRWEFGLLCLLGRTVRFGALALPAAWALAG